MSTKANILVIDDDEGVRESIAIILRYEGYSVDEAQNGKEAIAKSYENFYNLAIVDYRLPDIEGTELLGRLKETTPKMAKIMITGFPSVNNTIEAFNHSVDAFMIKPVKIEVLLRKVSSLLKEQEQTIKKASDLTKNQKSQHKPKKASLNHG